MSRDSGMNSSNRSSTRAPSTEYLAACDKGRSLVEVLNSPEAANPAYPSLDSSYSLEENKLRRYIPKEIITTLTQFDIRFKDVEYYSATPRVIKDEDVIYLNWFDARNRVIIANTNDKRKYKTPDNQRLFRELFSDPKTHP